MKVGAFAWLGLLFTQTLCAQSQVQTVAGGFLPNQIAATSGPIGYPISVATDSAGNCYFGAGAGSFQGYALNAIGTLNGSFDIDPLGPTAVYRLDKSGQITLIAGNGIDSTLGDGGPATSASIEPPVGLAVNKAETVLYIANAQRVRRVDLIAGTITTYVSDGPNGADPRAAFSNITSIAVDAAENLFLADSEAETIWRVDRASGAITKVMGLGFVTGKIPVAPTAVATDASGNLFFNSQTGGVYELSGGIRTTLSGLFVSAITVDARGKVYAIVNGHGNDPNVSLSAVEALAPTGDTIVAGNFTAYGFSGDGHPANTSQLNAPSGIAVDGAGNLFIADTSNARVRRVDGASGAIQTMAGAGIGSTNSIQATSALLLYPDGLAVDSHNLYFCEAGGFRLRSVDLVSGVLQTVTGDGAFNVAADGSKASTSPIPDCEAVALDGAGGIDFISAVFIPSCCSFNVVRRASLCPMARWAPSKTRSMTSLPTFSWGQPAPYIRPRVECFGTVSRSWCRRTYRGNPWESLWIATETCSSPTPSLTSCIARGQTGARCKSSRARVCPAMKATAARPPARISAPPRRWRWMRWVISSSPTGATTLSAGWKQTRGPSSRWWATVRRLSQPTARRPRMHSLSRAGLRSIPRATCMSAISPTGCGALRWQARRG